MQLTDFYPIKRGQNQPADMFLRKLKSVTGSMARGVEAAKKARTILLCSEVLLQNLDFQVFCTTTITPEDTMNFRIKIMSHGSSGCEDPPLPGSNDQVLKEFVIDCANKQSYSEYPGLCAYDFENKISITIHHLLGWDKNKKHNIEIFVYPVSTVHLLFKS